MPGSGLIRIKLAAGLHAILRQALSLTILAVPGATASILLAQALEEQNRPGLPNGEAREPAQAGAVEGLVTFRGEIPKSLIPDNAGVRRELLEVDSKTRGLRNVVAYLSPNDGSATERSGPSRPISPSAELVRVDQQDDAFMPCVVAVRAGQPVTFTNSDQANHNVRTSSPIATNVFNVVVGAEGKYAHRFVADIELRPIRLGCDIHPWMHGWIYVFDQPYFSVTDGQGRFRIGSVPPGRYKLVVHQPDIRFTTERVVTVFAGLAAKIEIGARTGDPAKSEE